MAARGKITVFAMNPATGAVLFTDEYNTVFHQMPKLLPAVMGGTRAAVEKKIRAGNYPGTQLITAHDRDLSTTRVKNPTGRRARKGPYPRGKTPPHLKKYLFKKGRK